MMEEMAGNTDQTDHTDQADQAETQCVPEVVEPSGLAREPTLARNLLAFGMLGLCNNFGYVIMLSAAHDILADHTRNETNVSLVDSSSLAQNHSGKLVPDCNKIGTGAILLADILPALIIKLTAPLYMQNIPYSFRVGLCTLLSIASYLLVALPHIVWINIVGVAFASVSSGLGEITFLALTSKYNRNCVSTWSSGTGAAGLLGALSYAGFTAAGLSSRNTILVMLVTPVILAVSYFFMLSANSVSVHSQTERKLVNSSGDLDSLLPECEPDVPAVSIASLSFCERLALVVPLLKYMIPLCLVYFAEYFINQALYELLYFEKTWPPKQEQYRWYQTIYQLGVFCSRSSVNVIKIKKIWIMTVLQFVVLTVLMLQIFLAYLPTIWIVFIIILFEGLLGGAAYVNTFYRVTVEISSIDRREYSLGVASVADSLGVSLAGAVSLPVHNFICTL